MMKIKSVDVEKILKDTFKNDGNQEECKESNIQKIC